MSSAPAVHGVYTYLISGEQDSVCEHDAPGPWTTDWDKVTCRRCLEVAQDRLRTSSGR